MLKAKLLGVLPSGVLPEKTQRTDHISATRTEKKMGKEGSDDRTLNLPTTFPRKYLFPRTWVSLTSVSHFQTRILEYSFVIQSGVTLRNTCFFCISAETEAGGETGGERGEYALCSTPSKGQPLPTCSKCQCSSCCCCRARETWTLCSARDVVCHTQGCCGGF